MMLVVFQEKHWFDADITMEYLRFLFDVMYPGKKAGLSMDMVPAYNNTVLGGKVAE